MRYEKGIYINQESILTCKGELVVYNQYFTVCKLIPVLNLPSYLDNYKFQPNQLKLYVSLYDTQTGDFHGLKQTVG